jgi:hypothetical protein
MWEDYNALNNVSGNNNEIIVKKNDGTLSTDNANIGNYITNNTIPITKIKAKDSSSDYVILSLKNNTVNTLNNPNT